MNTTTLTFNCPATGQPHRFTVPVEWETHRYDDFSPSGWRVVKLQCETCDEQREVKHAK